MKPEHIDNECHTNTHTKWNCEGC